MAKRLMDRWLSILLATAMVLELCPAPALAEVLGTTDDDGFTVLADEPADGELVIEALPEEESAAFPDDVVPTNDDPTSDDDPTVVTDEDEPAIPAVVEEDPTVNEDDPEATVDEDDPAPTDDEGPEEAEAEEDALAPDDAEDPEDATPEGEAPVADDDDEATAPDADEPAEPQDEEPAEDLEADDVADDTQPVGDESDDDILTEQGVTPKTDDETGFQYVVNSDGSTVTLYRYVGTPTSGQVIIPPVIGDKSVTAIGAQCFMGNTDITKAICDNTYMASAYMQLTTVGDEAFKNCSNLTRVELPRYVTTLGASCFAGTSKLLGINLLGANWYGNTADVAYSFGRRDTVQLRSIGNSCFQYSGIEVAYLPPSVWLVGDDAFGYCTKLRRVDMPQNGITVLGGGAFSNCTKLEEVTVPSGVYNILASTFSGCTALRRVYTYENLATIDQKAFYKCTHLEEFGMPGQMKTAYGAGKKLKTGAFQYEADTWGTTIGTINLKTIGREAFLDCQYMTGFYFCPGLTTVGPYAFLRCYDLQSAVLPNSVTSIGRTAFANCTSLTSFDFPENSSFTTIKMETLSGCAGIKIISVPSNVTKVETNAFKGMTGLDKAYFFNGTTELVIDGNDSPFTGCNARPVVYGPSGGKLSSTAATCQGKGHIKQFVAPAVNCKITFAKDAAESVKFEEYYTVDSAISLPGTEWTVTEGGVTYDFYGWSRRPGIIIKGGNVPTDVYRSGQGVTVSVDTTFYAVFSDSVQKATVNLVNSYDHTQDRSYTVKVGSKFTLPSEGFSSTSPKAYQERIFMGWISGGTQYDPDESVTIQNDTTFTARFVERNKLRFNAAGGTFTENGSDILDIFADSTGCVSPFPIPVRDGYHLIGWSASNGATVTESTILGTLSYYRYASDSTGPLIMTARWELDTPPVITLDADPGTVDGKKTVKVQTGSSFRLSGTDLSSRVVVPPTGYTFAGEWIMYYGETGAYHFNKDNISAHKFNAPATLHAVFVPKLVTKVTLNKTSATIAVSKTLQLKATVTPADAENTNVTWKSSNTSVATVSSTGKVTAKKAGPATITCTAADGSGKKATCSVKVTASISGASISAITDKVYTGSAIKPTLTVKMGSTTLKKDTDYTVSFTNNVNVGTASITITGKGNYTGTKSATFKIVPVSITKATVAAIADVAYTGKEIKPSPKVTFSGATLKLNTDYTISYSNNVNVSGKAKVILTGTGNFTGTKTVMFRIAFKDVAKSHPFYEKIHHANDLGIINGYSGANYGKFGPSDHITRGQIAVMLWNAAKQPKPSGTPKDFPDVASSTYYYEAVRWASSVGVVNGYDNGKFGPNDDITREQLATMVANYAKKMGGQSVTGSAADLSTLPDAAGVSAYAVPSVAWCYKKGIFVLQDGRLNAKVKADRATAAQMVADLYDLLH